MMTKEWAIEILEELRLDNNRDARIYKKSMPNFARYCRGRAGAYERAISIVKEIRVYSQSEKGDKRC